MMEETVINIVFSLVPSAIMLYVGYKVTAMDKKNDRMDELRRIESILVLKNIDAIGSLAKQTTLCIKGEKQNGDLDKAFEYREQLKRELEDYLLKVNASSK